MGWAGGVGFSFTGVEEDEKSLSEILGFDLRRDFVCVSMDLLRWK